MDEIEQPVTEMSVEECWTLLESHDFGRLAYRLVDEVHLVPINYVVEDRTLYFRTTSGGKLLAAALHSDVAFEIDWHDDGTAWSVVARGALRQLEEDEQHRLDSVASSMASTSNATRPLAAALAIAPYPVVATRTSSPSIT